MTAKKTPTSKPAPAEPKTLLEAVTTKRVRLVRQGAMAHSARCPIPRRVVQSARLLSKLQPDERRARRPESLPPTSTCPSRPSVA